MIISIIYLGITNGMSGILNSLEGIALGMGILLIPYIFGFTAAGDVKLMGAVGAALGPVGALVSYCYSALFGGVYALFVILSQKKWSFVTEFSSLFLNFVLTRSLPTGILTNIQRKKMKICYGLPIAVGTIFYIIMEITGNQLITF
jgi:prepilin peptidase CpaA